MTRDDYRQCVYCGGSKTAREGEWDDGLGNGGVEWYCVDCDKAWSDPLPEGRFVFLRFQPPPEPDGSSRPSVYGPFSWASVAPGLVRACKRRGLGPLEVLTVATATPDGLWLIDEALPGAVRRFTGCYVGHAPLIGARYEVYYNMDGVKKKEQATG